MVAYKHKETRRIAFATIIQHAPRSVVWIFSEFVIKPKSIAITWLGNFQKYNRIDNKQQKQVIKLSMTLNANKSQKYGPISIENVYS